MGKYFLFLAVLAVLAMACQPSLAWYPTGQVAIESYYETSESDVSMVVVTIGIGNRGSTSINRSTFTVKAQTEVRVYHKTVVSDLRLLPGSTVYVSAVVAYATVDEALIDNGLTLSDWFFE